MKKEVRNRLRAYSSLAGAAVAMAPLTAAGAVIYTDIDPDTTLGAVGDLYELDFDGDGTFDMNFAIVTATGTYGGQALYQNFAFAFGYGNGAFPGSIIYSSFYQPYAYNAGANVGAGAAWQPSTATGSLNYLTSVGGVPSFQGGNWVNAVDKYLGVQFTVGGNTHYGWVRMDVGEAGPGNFITIKDYAFNDVPDEAIDAGAGLPSGIEDGIADDVSLYGFGNTVYVQLQPLDARESELEVFDMAGKLVLTEDIQGTAAQVRVPGAAGVYAIRLRTDKGIVSRQVFLSGN